MTSKQSSAEMSSLAARVLGGYSPTREEVRSLAASVLSQDETPQADDAPQSQRLIDHVALLDKVFSGRDGIFGPVAETGELYDTLRSSGFTGEGDGGRSYPTVAEAVDQWIDRTRMFGWEDGDERVTGVLNWRTRPSLTGNQRTGYSVYSRLAFCHAAPGNGLDAGVTDASWPEAEGGP